MVSENRLVMLAAFFLLMLLFFSIQVGGEKPIVIATTTVLGSVVEDLAGDRVELHVVVSPLICPAHYDVKPSDVSVFSRARIILYHGFEPWVDSLYEASGSSAKLVKVSGSWSVPDGVKNYYREVASALEEELGLDVSNRLESALSEIDFTAYEIKSRANSLGVSGIKVVAMEWQKEFVEWVGFKVADSFGPPEKLSSADLERLVKVGRDNDVALVISNVQSGVDFGEALAAEIGAAHAVLSNYPWSSPEIRTLMDLMSKNAEELFDAVRLYELKTTMLELRRIIDLYQTLTYCLIILAAVEAALLVYMIRRRKG